MHTEKTSKGAWMVLLLLTVAIGISFVDRGTLSIALGSIRSELHLTESSLGRLSAAFFLSYTAMQLLVGKLLERVNAVRLYAAAFAVWSIATAFTGLTHAVHVGPVTATSFQMLFALRIVLGCGESISYPATAAIVTSLFPERMRGTANSMIDAGSKIGPALGIMLGTSVLIRFGWRAMFLWLGGISLLWLPLWLWQAGPATVLASSDATAPSFHQIAGRRSFWGAAIGHVGGNFAWSMFVAWLPYFFERSKMFTPHQLVWMSSAPFWILSVASLVSGYLSDRLIQASFPAIAVRKAVVTGGNVGTALALFAAGVSHSSVLAVIAILCGSFFLGFFSSNNWALAQTLAGQRASAKWTSLQNVFANLAAAAAAWHTGVTLEQTGNFSRAFFIAGAVLLLGAAAYWFGITDREPITWQEPHERTTPTCAHA